MKTKGISIKFHRCLLFFFLCVGLTAFVIPSYLGGIHMRNMMAEYIVYFRITFAVFALAALLFFIIRRVSGYDEENEVLYSSNALFFALAALAISLLYDSYSAGFFMTVILSTAVFRITLSLCPRDIPVFFVTNGIHILLIYCIRTDLTTDDGELGAVAIFAFIIPILTALFTVLLKKENGTLHFGRHRLPLCPKGTRYLPMYLSSAITLAGAVCAWMKYVPSIYTIAALAFLFIVTTIVKTSKASFGSLRK